MTQSENGEGAMSVQAWNEKPGRTQEEVLSLVDSAIARLS
jgi:hypothetical protein